MYVAWLYRLYLTWKWSDRALGSLTMWFWNWVYASRLRLVGSSLTWHLKLWPCGFKIDYTHLGFASAAAVPLGSDGDPGCIFFILNTCQATFISDILWNNCRKLKKMKVWLTDIRTDGGTDGRTDRREVWNSYLDVRWEIILSQFWVSSESLFIEMSGFESKTFG